MKDKHLIQIDKGKCIGCGLCRKDCPAGNLSITDKKASVITQDCIKCGHCVAICPKGAVSMTGFKEKPVEIETQERLNPDRLLEAVRTRRTIRHFTAKQVSPEIIKQIIEAGRLTPTGKNSQDVSYVVLQNKKDAFEKTAARMFRRLMPFVKLVNPMARNITIDDHFFFKKAPAVIVVLAKDKINGALASANMALMAEACGLGVLYSGYFTTASNVSRKLRRMLGAGHGYKAAATLVLGYSAVTYHRTAQKEEASVRML